MHGAAVKVNEASINARCVLFGRYLSARCDTTSQGDLKLARNPDRAVWVMRLSVSNVAASETAATFGSGSDTLQAKKKTATLRCYRFGPGCPDM